MAGAKRTLHMVVQAKINVAYVLDHMANSKGKVAKFLNNGDCNEKHT